MSVYRHATGWVTHRVAGLALEQGLQGDDKFNAALARFAEALAKDHAEFAEETRVRAERTRAGWAKRRERLKQQAASTGAPVGL